MGTGSLPSLAALLRTWRERAVLTQEQLAQRTGLGVRTIRRLEADAIGQPRGGSLRLLADALNLAEAERAQLFAASRPEGPAAATRQLPADVAGFIGRERYLKEMDAALVRDQPNAVAVVAIAGTAGVGKTSLAVHWAHLVADRFPDGQLYINLRGFHPAGAAMEPAEAIRGFLDALGVPAPRIPVNLDAQAGLYRSLLAGKRMLVVLDNARDPEQVRPLLPGTPGCLAVVTSRNQLAGLIAVENASPLSLDLPSHAEAREFLSRRLGAQRTAAEHEAADDIIDLCARLPLALAITSARAATRPGLTLADLAAELRQDRDRLNALDIGDAIADVRSVFSWSYRRLNPPAARLFRMLGLHPGPDIATAAAASLIATPVRETRPILAELVGGNLLTEHGGGRYMLHDLLRAYAAEQTHEHDDAAARHEALHRLFDHYLHTAWAADRLVDPTRAGLTLDPPMRGCVVGTHQSRADAVDWFRAEKAVLLATIEHAHSTGFAAHTWRLAWTLTVYLDWQGHWHENALALGAGLAATQSVADAPTRARIHRYLARAHSRLRSFDHARTHMLHAIELDRKAGNTQGVARTHQALAIVCQHEGLLVEALRHARRALVLYRAAGYPPGEAAALNSVGYLRALLGDHRSALRHSRKALSLWQEQRNLHGQAAALDSLGYAHHHLGDRRRALECFRRAVEFHRQVGDRYNLAEALTHLGDSYHAVGDDPAARTAWDEALAILNELDHPQAEQVAAKLALLTSGR